MRSIVKPASLISAAAVSSSNRVLTGGPKGVPLFCQSRLQSVPPG